MEAGTNGFKPNIVAIVCNWCTYIAADTAGVARFKYSPYVRIVRVMCSGRVDPQMVLWAFRQGADGVLVCGCHPGDCHYKEGNYKAYRRYMLLKRMIRQMGIDERRLRLEWISAGEAPRVKEVFDSFTEEIRRLGPLKLPVEAETRE